VQEAAPGAGTLRVRYCLPDPAPLVSIIIATRDGYTLLRDCIDSIHARTDYAQFEIVVVDNGSEDPDVLAYLQELVAKKNVRVLRDARPFNYSALNNAAARVARGQLLCLMNNDVQVITPGWLQEMASQAMRPEIGVVGCRLWYPDDTIQHAGIILGIGGVAGNAHHRFRREQAGYFSRATLVQNYSAVTAACAVVRSDVYWQVGGFDESLPVAFNDVDLCLRIRDAGYRNLWTPYAELYHLESASRGLEDTPAKKARFAADTEFMICRYGDALLYDPAYNPNLALRMQDYTLAHPPRIERIGITPAAL
jgi:GT2 family glycosyltransferase